MAILTNITEMLDANIGDEIYLGSFKRVLAQNGVWTKEFYVDAGVIENNVTKEQIQSLGFMLESDCSIDYLEEIGVQVNDLDYQFITSDVNGEIQDYGLITQSPTNEEIDYDFGSLDY